MVQNNWIIKNNYDKCLDKIHTMQNVNTIITQIISSYISLSNSCEKIFSHVISLCEHGNMA